MMYGCHPLFTCKRNAFVRLVGLAVRRRMARLAYGSRALAWAGRPCAATRQRGSVLELAEKNNGEVASSEVMDLLD